VNWNDDHDAHSSAVGSGFAFRMNSARDEFESSSGADSAAYTRHPDVALFVVVIGVLITAIDATIVVLALPKIQEAFHIGLTSVIWVVIGYLFVITLVSTQVGRFGDMFGRVMMYETGFIIFVIGSVACALAWDELSLIIFRLIQGLGGAFIVANSGAVVADIFPKEQRGRAYGFNSIGFNAGAVLGVVLGGVIVTYLSWRWIFWINVPIGIGSVALARRVLFDHSEREHREIDWLGVFTMGLGLFCILWGMVKLISEPFGVSIGCFFVIGVLSLLLFWKIESKVTEPMLDFTLFRLPTLLSSLLAAMIQSLANFAVLLLILMYLQGVRGLDPIRASMLLVPGYLLSGVAGPFAGRFADQRGPVAPATIGLGLQIVALVAYAQLGTATPLWFVVVAYIIGAVGAGFFFPANNAAVMKIALGDSFGITFGLLRTFAYVGMVFSFALAILVASTTLSRREAFALFVGTDKLSHSTAAAFTTGLHAAFYFSTCLMMVAVALSLSRGGRRKNLRRG
jgi:EmrB/QacA subfamily drug resistance transporter